MRMEELANNSFVKGTDSVERYLLDIIKRYFSSNNIDTDSREYIINRAVKQMKEELNIDNAGVISVNGQTGDVEITLDSLGGEPLISPKLSAFNVNFGSEENTACMGNDPRLSDSRQPLPHEHEISDINGLAGELSAIRNNIALLGGTTHRHDNLSILNKLIYSGKNSEIDLTLLDTLENKVNDKIIETDATVLEYQTKLNDLLDDVTDELTYYENDYSVIKAYIDNGDNTIKNNIKQYCDDTLNAMKADINTVLDGKVNKTQMTPIITEVNKQYSVMYELLITNFITSNDSNIIHETILPNSVVETLNNKDYKINFYFKYYDPATGNEVTTNLPFIHTESGNILYSIKTEILNNAVIRITSTKDDSKPWVEFIDSGIVKLIILVKNNLVEV